MYVNILQLSTRYSSLQCILTFTFNIHTCIPTITYAGACDTSGAVRGVLSTGTGDAPGSGIYCSALGGGWR